MARLIIRGFTISLDGYGAGPNQSLENPLGVGGESLHDWLVSTRTFQLMLGKEGGELGVDEDFAAQSMGGIGAWILGRNMFGPVRGPWPDESWRGWWGKNPPYHAPVFVLTNHKRPPLEMEGRTVFHFVTEGIPRGAGTCAGCGRWPGHSPFGRRRHPSPISAGSLGCEMHWAVSPILLASGEHLLADLDLPALGYQITECVPSAKAVHYTMARC